MANWCFNKLVVGGLEEDIKKFISEYQRTKFSEIVPATSSAAKIYKWCDGHDDDVELNFNFEGSLGELTARFRTCRAVPDSFAYFMSERFPHLWISLYYDFADAGCYGEAHFHGEHSKFESGSVYFVGRALNDDYLEFSRSHSIRDKKV